MRRLARWMSYGGCAVAVLMLSLVHARFVADNPYSFAGSSQVRVGDRLHGAALGRDLRGRTAGPTPQQAPGRLARHRRLGHRRDRHLDPAAHHRRRPAPPLRRVRRGPGAHPVADRRERSVTRRPHPCRGPGPGGARRRTRGARAPDRRPSDGTRTRRVARRRADTPRSGRARTRAHTDHRPAARHAGDGGRARPVRADRGPRHRPGRQAARVRSPRPDVAGLLRGVARQAAPVGAGTSVAVLRHRRGAPGALQPPEAGDGHRARSGRRARPGRHHALRRARRPARQPRSAHVPPDPRRQGRRALHDPEVPHHARAARRGRPHRLDRTERPADHARSATCCAARTSTSCPR